MKNILKIFFSDLKSMKKNKVVVFIMVGLCILPSLYAWVNLYACWDPYSNTGNLPVVVVNGDEGSTFNDKYINTGDKIVENLKKNDSIGWVFEDEWQANNGLNNGKYYALVKIPADYTRKLLTLASTDPQKPNIIYKENEKANAIANKITQVAVSKLSNEIKSNFIETVYKESIEVINDMGKKLEENKPQIVNIQNVLNNTSKDLDKVSGHINDVNSNSNDFIAYIKTIQDDLPTVLDMINNLQNIVHCSKNLNLYTKQSINDISNNLNNDIMQMQNTNTRIKELINNLKIETNNNEKLDIADQIDNLYESLNNSIIVQLKILNLVYDFSNNAGINNLMNLLKSVQDNTAQRTEILKEIINDINNNTTKEDLNKSIDRLYNLSSETGDLLITVSNNLYSNTLPAFDRILDGLSIGLDNIDLMVETSKNIVPKLNSISNFAIATNKLSIKQANELNKKINELNDDLKKLIEDTDGFNDKNVNDMLDLMSKDPELISSFMSSPIDVVEEDVYDTVSFGFGLTPFYTVLAIWIGTLLAACLLKPEMDEEDKKRGKIKYHQEHFGKMLTLLFISVIQALIIMTGNILLIGVKPDNLFITYLFTMMTSLTFTVIIFTLVSMLGSVGKAAAVIMMVFQIAGSGGIYPIETNPEIFGILQPLWPFTYAMAGLREGLSGAIPADVFKNLGSLSAFILIFLLMLLIKKPVNKVASYLNEIFEKAGI